MNRRASWLTLALLFQLAWVAGAGAEAAPSLPFLHPLFASHMVLQRDIPDPIWGWTEPGTKVTVSMNGKTADAIAGPDGKWMAKLGPFSAGGPFELTVSGPKEVKLTNVLVGDVWICSGQSNMEMGIGNGKDAQQEIAAADHPMLRLFTVAKHVATEPQKLFVDKGEENKWLVCTPQNVMVGDWAGFSAAGYFFGRELQEKLKIPIGLIHTSWGGTVAEAWTSGEALDAMPDFADALRTVRSAVPANTTEPLEQQVAKWYARVDPGTGAGGAEWAAAALPDQDWKTIKLSANWDNADGELKNLAGVAWFRKTIEIPAEWIGEPLKLHLGHFADRDTTWVNGAHVGGHDLATDQRDYLLPAELTKDGKLTIAIRVLSLSGHGPIADPLQQLKIEHGSDSPVTLGGDWKYKVGATLAKSGNPPQPPSNNPNQTTVLYNGMIAPLIPFAIKGAVWYQGESNADRWMQYRTLLPTMIKDWRNRFGVGEFPFFIVQIAAFMAESDQPQEAPWPGLREAQALTAQNVGHSGIAIATDIGDAKDIHPKNKQEVGRRLALDAEATVYGQDVEYAGPTFKEMETKDNQIVLHYTHLGGGLDIKGGGPLKGFAISGEDKKFVWADAKIDGDTVIVSSPMVPHPVAVRYAWENNPAKANLFNKAGLPAPPFRTDVPK